MGSNWDSLTYPNTKVFLWGENMDLKESWRMLWEQHVWWTRELIKSIAFNLPDEKWVTQRLLRTATDMGNIFRTYYGEEKANHFTHLMQTHLVIAAQLVKAAKAGKSKLVTRIEHNWYVNADEIAAYLNMLNPYWPRDVVASMLHEHLALTKSEAVSILTKDYVAGIVTFDKIEQQALMMADAFADGLMKQFRSY